MKASNTTFTCVLQSTVLVGISTNRRCSTGMQLIVSDPSYIRGWRRVITKCNVSEWRRSAGAAE